MKKKSKKQAKPKDPPKPKPEGYVFGRPSDYKKEVTIAASRQYLDLCKDGYEQVVVGERTVYAGKGKNKKAHVVKEMKYVYKVNLPSIEGLANHLHVSRDTCYQWAKDYEDFSDILDDLRGKQAAALINNSLSGNYHSTIAKVLLTKHGYVEKVETDNKHKGVGSLVGLFERAAARRKAESEEK